ncbi:alpha,alpha-trehalase [Aquimarina amphilecti]|uniref:Alpha,alpha-trehalase n=1 Tax=Aquimarina amphilecti TaxID=1038014 RepID=A0A1H7N973_AQUAM|nr:trehalase family glycosidase [Aquimarina amphilecti]SEL20024.1 alpha,alpha-trehalase [Aquimarina amphilecti]
MRNFKFLATCLLAVFLFNCNDDKKIEYLGHQQTLDKLISQEDTDGDKKITIDDKGPKQFEFIDGNGNVNLIEGTYHLSNLLQELAIADKNDTISLDKIKESPSNRISRLIKTRYWDNLTRSVDKKGLAKVLEDTKSDTDTFRLYVPFNDKEAIDYFESIKSHIPKLKVITLPEDITPTYVKTLNEVSGILNLAHNVDEEGNYQAKPFVVPGGRFNEMYGWDSYFESVGLLIDGRADLAMSMADNFGYQIEHYGKILNANRSYYLTRTQPPFFSSLLREIYQQNPKVSRDWLSSNLKMVIKEYKDVWSEKDVRLTNTGLSRFYAEGIGIPPETEKGHFDFILNKYAEKHKLSLDVFVEKYDSGEIKDKELDLYFTHDRSMRESGHDTSNRLDDVCVHLNTVGINSLLYKYEKDIAYLIREAFNDKFVIDSKEYSSVFWLEKAEERNKLMNDLLWDKEKEVYYDYNFVTKTKQEIESATNYYPLWAGLSTKDQAASLVKNLFDNLVQKGGVAATMDIANKEDPNAPQRQWDYPNGWAPHQMMIWRGLINYGYEKEAQELVYRWLWMITKNAVNYNGTIPEKYDVVKCTHKVYAEYGNVGTEFDYITPSGFGWMNASYQLGLSILDKTLQSQLDQLVDPDDIFNKRD